MPIWFIIWMLAWFTWLAYETEWFTIRLPVGVAVIECTNGRFEPMLCWSKQCNPPLTGTKWSSRQIRPTYKLPARTVKIFGSTINFKSGCNRCRAKLLKDIVRAQRSKTMPTYHYDRATDNCYWDNTIELLVDGKSIANINGDYKRGVIKNALKPYTTKARVGRHTVTWDFGEADRVV